MDPTDELSAIVTLGNIAKSIFEERQRIFDESNPYLTDKEAIVAKVLQGVIKDRFDAKLKKKDSKDLKGMDIIELRLWAPDVKCAMVQLWEYITKEYGLFHRIAESSGLLPIAMNKLFYIVFAIRTLEHHEMFPGKPDQPNDS
jgi:hypothetical protein